MSTTTDTSTLTAYFDTIVGWGGEPVRVILPRGTRLLLPFTERAEALPDRAEAILREALSWLGEVANSGRMDPVEEPGLVRAAQRYVDRHYPVEVAA